MTSLFTGESAAPLLEVVGVKKNYPGVQALRGVHLKLLPGSILGLLGENGAGKSTLIKLLAGAERPDEGEIRIRGQAVRLKDPAHARRLGIAVMHQELKLVRSLSVLDNLFLGQEQTRLGWLRRGVQRQFAWQALSWLNVDLDLNAPCGSLSVAQQQLVEIARGLLTDSRLLVLDEPTAALSSKEADLLLERLITLKARGLAIVYVSHRLEEVFRITDQLVILRDGALVADLATAATCRESVVEAMVGRRLQEEFPPKVARSGPVLLEARKLCRLPAVQEVSFSLHAGEVLGLTGLIGSGRTETARLLFGADKASGGELFIQGQPVRLRSPRAAIRRGVALLTEDRKSQGLFARRSATENFSLPSLKDFTRWGLLRVSQESRALAALVTALDIRLASLQQRAGELSGGNQQKLLLARWLQRQTPVLIFDEPTRGIDVGARHHLYQLIRQLAAQAKGILVISSDFAEIRGLCDRILIMRQGRIVNEIQEPESLRSEELLLLAMPTTGTEPLAGVDA